MTINEFENWILEYCPLGVNPDDFVDRLAMGCISVIEASHQNTKTPIKAILAGFYDFDRH